MMIHPASPAAKAQAAKVQAAKAQAAKAQAVKAQAAKKLKKLKKHVNSVEVFPMT